MFVDKFAIFSISLLCFLGSTHTLEKFTIDCYIFPDTSPPCLWATMSCILQFALNRALCSVTQFLNYVKRIFNILNIFTVKCVVEKVDGRVRLLNGGCLTNQLMFFWVSKFSLEKDTCKTCVSGNNHMCTCMTL